MQLDPTFRRTLYGVLAALFVTGAAWLVANTLKDSASAELWQSVAANLLMIHGGAAMVILMLLGALFPLHIRRAWRSKRNRSSGIIIAASNALLIITAFGLYYWGSEILRTWASALHTGVGLALPVLALVHVVFGRRSSRDRRAVTTETVGEPRPSLNSGVR